MSEMKPGLLEEFSEIVAATRSLLEADQARGVRGYQRLSRSQLRAAVAETAPIEEAHGGLSMEHPPQEMVLQVHDNTLPAAPENALGGGSPHHQPNALSIDAQNMGQHLLKHRPGLTKKWLIGRQLNRAAHPSHHKHIRPIW